MLSDCSSQVCCSFSTSTAMTCYVRFFFFKQKTAYELRISDWSSDVCSSDLLEVIKWIKEDDNLRSIPVVAVTAFAMKGDEEKMREGGCDAYIAKQIGRASCRERVCQYV